MQFFIDTDRASQKEIELAAAFFAGLVGVDRIKPEDNPETGIVAPPAVTPLAKAMQERGMPPPPSLEIAPPPAADPAVVFGGAAVPLPPAPPPASPASGAAASPPTAAAPPAPGAAPASSSVELDSTGLPWDVRIHAANRAKNQNGSWRAKRGIDDDTLIARVEAELRAVMALPAAAAPPPPVEQPPAAPPAAAVFTATATPDPQQSTIAFGAAGAPPPPVAVAPQTFPEFMTALTPAMSQNRVTQALITEACTSVGLPSLPLLAARADLIPTVFDYIRSRVQL